MKGNFHINYLKLWHSKGPEYDLQCAQWNSAAIRYWNNVNRKRKSGYKYDVEMPELPVDDPDHIAVRAMLDARREDPDPEERV